MPTNWDAVREHFGALIERAKEAGPNDEGHFVVRARSGEIPFRLPMSMRKSPAAPAIGADGEPAVREKRVEGADTIVRGIASSTSVDWYGTEMSRRGLDGMAQQFNHGVPLLPRHGGMFDSVEWDEVFGLTQQSVISRASVGDPADISEEGFTLEVDSKLDMDDPKARTLVRKLEGGHEIGMSIGGWFLEMRFIENEQGGVERVIIEEVQLDHLAVVRSPANPDSVGLQLLSSVVDETLGKLSQALSAPAPMEPVVVTDDTGIAYDTDADESDAIEVTPLGAATRGIGEDSPLDATLDITSMVSDDHIDDGPPVGELDQRGTDPEENDMENKELLEQLLAGQMADREARAAEKAAMDARLDALEERTAPAPVADPRDAELADLRAKATRLELEVTERDNLLGSFAGRTNRRGAGIVPALSSNPQVASREVGAMVSRAKSDGNSRALCAVVERCKVGDQSIFDLDSNSRGAAAEKYQRALTHAPQMLRSLLNAAETDGIIGTIGASW